MIRSRCHLLNSQVTELPHINFGRLQLLLKFFFTDQIVATVKPKNRLDIHTKIQTTDDVYAELEHNKTKLMEPRPTKHLKE